MIRRLRVPAILLLIGILALLDRMGVVHSFWRYFWPLLLIVVGVTLLAERVALVAEGGYPMPFSGAQATASNPGAVHPGIPYPGSATGVPTYPGQPVAQVPTRQHNEDEEGGQS